MVDNSQQDKSQSVALELEDRVAPVPTSQSEVHHLDEKIEGGDEVLEILQTNFVPYTKEEEMAVRRKVDFRLIPLMLLLNGMQLVDKNTLSYAGIFGIAKEIDLVGQQYSWLVSIFYIAYFAAQYPTNVLMQKLPTGKYISINFMLWGITLTASAAAKSFKTLAVARFFLGVFESCLNPGFVLITSAWWKRDEQVSRTTIWASANGLFGALSGFVFYGIAHMNTGNMYPYQWMFLFTGITTVLIGSSLWWILPDSPVRATFLTERERLIAVERIRDNMTGTKNYTHKKEQVIEALTDIKVWLLFLGTFLHNLTGPLQSTFAGIIIKGFGFSTYNAILLNIPPAVTWFIGVFGSGMILSTKWGHNKRILLMILFCIPGIAAALILKLVPDDPSNKGVKLLGVYFTTLSAATSIIMYTLLASNVAGYTKKVVAGSMFFTAQSVGQIVAPQAYLARQAPKYQTGINLALGALVSVVGISCTLFVLYWRENKRRRALFEATDNEHGTTDGTVEDLILAFSDMTDKKNTKLLYKL